jgi:hypothetical protein
MMKEIPVVIRSREQGRRLGGTVYHVWRSAAEDGGHYSNG